ncbi:hypothetical protein ACGFMK_02970 [Amycolatopsis sp. NPDC049252]|uniref:hypothetical protein n=1 Tax=Amycolatopsis sp. NPDC049252 TaxID=3363933 RepID=UPI00371A2484
MPSDRPALIVAEGLTMYLTPEVLARVRPVTRLQLRMLKYFPKPARMATIARYRF